MERNGGVEVQFHLFLASILHSGECSASRPGHFIAVERSPIIHRIGRWLGPKASLDALENRKISALAGNLNTIL
jgi:hypothetical protein